MAARVAEPGNDTRVIRSLEYFVPSYRVSGPTLILGLFDVVGQDSDEFGFVGHAGLAASAGSQAAAKLPVRDMGPPLHGVAASGHVRADVVGCAALTDDEANKIKTFVDRHANEHLAFAQLSTSQIIQAAPQMYCVHPHASRLYEEGMGGTPEPDSVVQALCLKPTKRPESGSWI